MKNLDGILSLSRKAGMLVIGQDNLLGYQKKLYVLLLDKTAGKSLLREVNFMAKQKNLPLFEIENLGKFVGIENCKVLGVKNKAFSEKIIEFLKGE